MTHSVVTDPFNDPSIIPPDLRKLPHVVITHVVDGAGSALALSRFVHIDQFDTTVLKLCLHVAYSNTRFGYPCGKFQPWIESA